MKMCANCANGKWLDMKSDLPDGCKECLLSEDGPTRWKPKTNYDRIMAMTDKELANFLADRFVKNDIQTKINNAHPMTATQISVLYHTWYTVWMQWLMLPAGED